MSQNQVFSLTGRYLQVGDDQWMYFKQDGSLAIGQVRASI